MDQQLSGPDKDDPMWTAARGFVVREAEGALRLINGGHEKTRVKVTGDQTGGRLSLMKMGVAPGFGNQAHAHGVEDEAFYVASGKFLFLNGNRTFEAGPGDFIYVPKLTRHAFKNIGTEEADLLVFYTPAGAEQFFLKNGDEPDSEGNPPPAWTPERFAALAGELDAHHMILLPNDDWS
ncbi:hypothetical protein Vqi01_21320 [Micromonospora qiuiae]|uniref:Cupin type-2 domain-containing protein n=1 Tax=Micromonospora qiuiae TaxID=502268 RepID=A0ABQ4J9Y2_9ACTN|nr:cupin domain-containing protein [Micromonospora qiuiae]GIJ26970.1 hypothetical protein Vqi01_21320 [Micromonospora qiuiae]